MDNIRWTMRRDMPYLLEIEQYTHNVSDAWSEDKITKMLRKRNVIGMVYEIHNDVVASMVYSLHPRALQLLRLVVHPDYRRHGIGSRFIDKLKGKIGQSRWWLKVIVPDYNTPGQLFLRHNGLECRKVLRNNDNDNYLFTYFTKTREKPLNQYL